MVLKCLNYVTFKGILSNTTSCRTFFFSNSVHNHNKHGYKAYIQGPVFTRKFECIDTKNSMSNLYFLCYYYVKEIDT